MPLILSVSKLRNGDSESSFRFVVTLPVTYFKYWDERGFEVKRVEFTEGEGGTIILKPVLTPKQLSVAPTVPESPESDWDQFVEAHPGTVRAT